MLDRDAGRQPGRFRAIVAPTYDYLTGDRVAIADSYETDKIAERRDACRPVVGGFFIKMLSDRDLWKKYSTAGR